MKWKRRTNNCIVIGLIFPEDNLPKNALVISSYYIDEAERETYQMIDHLVSIYSVSTFVLCQRCFQRKKKLIKIVQKEKNSIWITREEWKRIE